MSEPKQLQRILGIGFGLAIVVGGTVGVGILRMPATIASYTTNPFLFISFWIAGGFIAIVGALIYAELGTRFPVAGGPYELTKKSIGEGVGFVTGWCDWIYNAGTISFLAIAVTEYLVKLLNTDLPNGLISSILIVLLTALQWQGLRLSSHFQKVMSALKALALLFFVVACFVYFLSGHTYQNVLPTNTLKSLPLFSIIILSLRAVFVAYNGWNTAVYFTEEDTNPNKNLPRSLIWGVVSVMIIYVLVNIGLMAVLPLSVIAQTTLPAADAAQLIFGGSGAVIVTIISLISIFGILNAELLFTPRILFAVARSGLFLKWGAKLNKNSIPGNALLLTGFVAILFAMTGVFNLVVDITALLAMVVDLSVYIAILFDRKKNHTSLRPFKAKAYPYNALFMILVTLGLIIGLFFEDTTNCVYALLIIALALPVYFLSKKLNA